MELPDYAQLSEVEGQLHFDFADSRLDVETFDSSVEKLVGVEPYDRVLGQQLLLIDAELIDLEHDVEEYLTQLWDKKVELENNLERLRHDELTGLLGREAFMKRLQKHIHTQDTIATKGDADALEVRRGGEFKDGLALLFIDLDNFKYVNDTHGHGEGDRVLLDAGFAIRASIRPEDVAARIGGDEFVVLLNAGISDQEAQEVSDRIAEGIRTIQVGGDVDVVGASIGIQMHEPGMTAEEMMDIADRGMYDEKRLRKEAEAQLKKLTESAYNMVANSGLDETGDFRVGTNDPIAEALQFMIHRKKLSDTQV